jgi:hypothetical protein
MTSQPGHVEFIGSRFPITKADRESRQPQGAVAQALGRSAVKGTPKAPARHAAARGSIGVLRLQKREGRQEQDLQIKQDRPVLDVVDVAFDALFDLFGRVDLAAPAVDLRPAGDAGLDLVAGEIAVDDLVPGLVVGVGVDRMRPRPDQRQARRASTLKSCGSSSIDVLRMNARPWSPGVVLGHDLLWRADPPSRDTSSGTSGPR